MLGPAEGPTYACATSRQSYQAGSGGQTGRVLIGQRVREVRGKYRGKTSSKEVKEAFFLPCGNHASYCPGPGLIVEDDSFYNHRHCKSGTEQSQNTTVQLHDFTQLYDSSHA